MCIKKIKNRLKEIDKYTKYAIIIIIIGILIRFFLASISYITGDACWHVNIARFIANNLRIPLYEPLGRDAFWPQPLFHIIMAAFYRLFLFIGDNAAEFSVKMVSPLMGSLNLLMVFLIAKKLFNKRVAFFSVLFLTFIPNHLYLSSIAFVETTVTFFCLVSLYFMINKRVFLSGLFAGLALFTKVNAVFLVILNIIIIYIYFKRKRFWKYLVIFLISTSIFGAIAYLRNWILLGNPVWPFFNFIFQDTSVYVAEYSSFSGSLMNLFNLKHYLNLYLTLFGVPEGNFRNLFFINISFLNVLLVIWFFGTMLFFIPILVKIFKFRFNDKRNKILFWWIFLFFFMLLLNIITNDLVYLRHAFPAIPVIGIIWALGFNKIITRFKKFSKYIFILLILIIIGFICVEFVKAVVVKNTWNVYREDFEWVKENTPKDAIFLIPFGDCYTYNMDRYTYAYYQRPYVNDTTKIKDYNVSYIWVNQEINFYGLVDNDSSAYPREFINDLDYPVVYYNNKTKTKVYKVE